MPNALIRVRFASAIVRSDPTGWNMPWKRTGSPVSTPYGTMSSMSKSMVSPMRTLWRSPSSFTSIAARSTPRTSPTRGARAPIGHDLGCVGDDRHLAARDIGAVDLTPLDVEDQSHPAIVVGGSVVEGQIARAHQLTRAGLDVTS